MTRAAELRTVRNLSVAVLCSGAAFALAGPGVASAATTAAANDADPYTIIVTAQKREQDVQQVPISMSVIEGDQLQQFNIKDFIELDRYVPNFFVQATPGNNAFYIRGIGSTPGNLAFEQTVGLFVDGLYGGHARQFQAPFLDVERVEVLRGPQGALVGKNTSAGAINVITAKPTRDFEASAELSHEFEQDGNRAFGVISGPLSDNFSGRLAAQYEDTDGYIKNLTLGGDEPKRESVFARGSLMYDNNDGINVLWRLEGGNVDLTGNAVERILTPSDPNLERSTGGFPGFVGKDFDDTNTLNSSITTNLDIGEFVLTSITGYSSYDYKKRLDSDFSPANLFASMFAEDFSQISQEFRLTSPAGKKIEYIVGIYGHYNDYDLDQSTRLDFGPYDGLSQRWFRQHNTTVSTYGSLTWHVTDDLRLLGSLRYTFDKRTANQDRANTGAVLPSYLATPLSGRLYDREWDPSVAIQYDVTPDIMVYTSYGQGSKAGGFIGAQATTLPGQFVIRPESSESWEAGIKLAALDRRLRLSIAAYRTTFDDLQVSTWDTTTASFVTSNAGKARSQGVESNLNYALFKGFDVFASFAYLDTEFLDFPGALCAYNLVGCTPATNNAKGYPLPRAPKRNGSVGFNAEFPLINGWDFVGSGTLTFRSFAYLEETYNPAAGQPGYGKYDLRAGVRSPDKHWEVALVGKNLGDKITASHAFNTPVTGGISKFIQEPRTIALQANYSY